MLKNIYVDVTPYCEEAKLNTQRLINIISLNDTEFGITNDIEQADLVLYYACGHLKSLEDRSIRDLNEILRLKKDSSRLIVWGCLPKINPELIKEIYDGALIGPEEAGDFFCSLFNLPKEKILNIHTNKLYLKNEQIRRFDESSKLLKIDNRFNGAFSHIGRVYNNFKQRFYWRSIGDRWYIKIEDGCKNSCTYCSDRLVYKTVKSELSQNIIDQIDLGLRKGYRFFYLIGRDLGSYGQDLGINLPVLLNRIIDKFPNKNCKLILYNISPNSLIEMYPELEHLLSSGNVFELGCHIQSGSDKVLKLMGKTFTTSEWRWVIKDICKKYPKIRLLSSVMVGFPGETEEDFTQTIDSLKNGYFDNVDVYEYSERPNLPAVRLKGIVSEWTKKKRYVKTLYYANFCSIKKRIKRSLRTFSLPKLLIDLIDLYILMLKRILVNFY
jgi:tRNA A37 methylthiotransferase MiaB